MKYILIILLLTPFVSSAQYKLFGNGGYNINGNRFYLINGTDTIASFRTDSILLYKPTNIASALVLKGTLNWTPGSVGAGSSTSTTVSITGAVGGDGVVVTKVSGGYSNGEIYDAWVSAPGVVTVRVHNVSSGGATYGTATDYNVIVIKY
jgi:hypothetical protein